MNKDKPVTLDTTVRELIEKFSVPGWSIIMSKFGELGFHNISSEGYRNWDKTINEIAIEYEFKPPYIITTGYRGQTILLVVGEVVN